MAAPAPKRNILIVGEPATELAEVCVDLSALAPQWNWEYAPSGMAALDCLTDGPFHAVVTDLQIRDLTGLQLLNQVMTQWPQTTRVILADLGNLDALLRCVGGLHQFLARPCDPQRLLTVLERALTLDIWLPNQTVRRLLGRLPSLPSSSSDYHATVEAIDRQDLPATARRIADDPPLAAKILQLANSAAWGPPLDEANAMAAAMELGLPTLRRTLLLAHNWSAFREIGSHGFQVAAFQQHARQTSQLARRIAQLESAPQELVEQAAAAGLLHNLGKLALAVNLPEKQQEVARLQTGGHLTSWEAEHGVFGATHGEVGASLLGIWGLPMPVIEAVAFHHHPTCFLTQSFCPLTAVHVANVFVASPSFEAARQRLDLPYLESLGLTHRLSHWWEGRPEPEPPEAPRE